MYWRPAIFRVSAHREVRPEPVATPPAPPDPPVAECAAFIRLCRDRLVPLLDRAAGVTSKELRILRDLRSERGDCASEIGRRLAIDDGEMSRLISRLEARELLGRTAARDRRKTALRLTPTGRALVDRSNWAEHMVLEARLEGLSAEEQAKLREAMSVVTTLLCGRSVE
jgi:DNA-binding MarR family transcriptional regulator